MSTSSKVATEVVTELMSSHAMRNAGMPLNLDHINNARVNLSAVERRAALRMACEDISSVTTSVATLLLVLMMFSSPFISNRNGLRANRTYQGNISRLQIRDGAS